MWAQQIDYDLRLRLMGYPFRVRVVGKKTSLSSSAASQLKNHWSRCTNESEWHPVWNFICKDLDTNTKKLSTYWIKDKDGLPKTHYKMMEENRDDNTSKLIARAQPGSATKRSKQVRPDLILKFIVPLHQQQNEHIIPSKLFDSACIC